ncbi:MAG: hypothetical protein KJO54_05840 [Gammaproteobacteria bacterium]|nr:hypothetical protein [Gammaproteobacteria bacterium]
MSTSPADRISTDQAAAAAGSSFVVLKKNNLVERPWGGLRMLDYKGSAPLPDQKKLTGNGVGEAFEVAACATDPESNQYPSRVLLGDNTEMSLPQLLSAAGREILGKQLFDRCGGEIPLLPKTLDIQELLSVQAHPPGNTELYVIIDAEPGATLRLGFRHTVDPDALRSDLLAARSQQEQLLTWLQPDVDQFELQNILAPSFADRSGDTDTVAMQLSPLLRRREDYAPASLALKQLKLMYWQILDMMNEIPLHAGQVIYNATPERICAATGAPVSAEVHALGNPQQLEVMMLEIRRPGVTYRAWDNVRFPLREIDIDQTLKALNLSGTNPAEFEVKPKPVNGEPNAMRLVAGDHFIVDRLSVTTSNAATVTAGYFHTLHCVSGDCRLTDTAGNAVLLTRGSSVIAPAGLREYRVSTASSAELIRVQIPPQ